MFASVLNIDERTSKKGTGSYFSFDSDSSSIICDNSANVSICNDKTMFVGDISKVQSHSVATIGGKGHFASGVGTVRWRWKDDYGSTHEYLVENVLYFPQLPINILSITSFADRLDDK